MANFIDVVLVDDLRSFRNNDVGAIVVRNTEDALNFFKTNKTARFGSIWLDHDLGEVNGQKITTMPVVDYFCERAFSDDPVNVGTIYVHTSNPPGRRQIVTSLQRYGYSVILVNPTEYFTVG